MLGSLCLSALCMLCALQAATPPSDVYDEGLRSAFQQYASFGTRGESEYFCFQSLLSG